MAVEAPRLENATPEPPAAPTDLSRRDIRLLNKEAGRYRCAKRPNRRSAIEASVAYGVGPIGSRAKVVLHRGRRNSETNRRVWDASIGAGPKAVGTWIPTLATHGNSGMDTTYSMAGLGRSRHPLIGEQDIVQVAMVQAAVGELSAVGLEVPLGLLAVGASLVGASDFASIIFSMGARDMLLTKAQFKVHLERKGLERVKEKINRITDRIPKPQIKERIQSRWKKQSGLTIEEELEQVAKEKIPEPV